MLMTLQSSPAVPAGMIQTLNGDILPNTGRSDLIAKLQEAYVLDGEVTLKVDGGEAVTVPLSLEQARSLSLTTLGGVDLDEATCPGIEKLAGDEYRLTYADGAVRRLIASCSDYWTLQG